MEVTYTTTINDVIAFNVYFQNNNKAVRAIFRLLWLVLPIVIVGSYLAYDDFSSPRAWIVALVTYIVATAIFPFIWWIITDPIVRFVFSRMDVRGMIGEMRLILSEVSLVEVTCVTRTEMKWSAIHDVAIDGDRTYIFVTSTSAVILPRHGFASSEKYDAIQKFAVERFRNARGS